MSVDCLCSCVQGLFKNLRDGNYKFYHMTWSVPAPLGVRDVKFCNSGQSQHVHEM